MEHLPELFRDHRVRLVCSLPCYTAENVDQQRGDGVFERSIEALRLLGELGYGRAGSGLVLDLVYNPLGPFLPPDQSSLAARYHRELRERYGIEFNELVAITNMPIKRFAEQLRRSGELDAYMDLLSASFNPSTVDGLMCRSMVSVGWEGRIHDCDFNQMLDIDARRDPRSSVGLSIDDIESFDELAGTPVTTGAHCFGCTAGRGSSCGGALQGATSGGVAGG